MKRLTNKNKLGQLEDIEEELGIDLLTLFKALKDGIWVIKSDKIVFLEPIFVDFKYEAKDIFTTFWYGFTYFKIKDYGKTWALTKEELE